MQAKFWVLGGLLALVTGCAPLTPEEAAEQNLNSVVVSSRPSDVLPPRAEIEENLNPEPNHEFIPTLPCECHIRATENNGLICFRMVCSSGCDHHTQECATLFGGCTTR